MQNERYPAVAGPSRSDVSIGRGISRSRAGHPSTEFQKEGKLGTELQLTSNFFRVLSTPTVHFLQYHVVFKPEMELIALRMGLLKQHADLLGKHLYNGSVLYCTAKLPQVV